MKIFPSNLCSLEPLPKAKVDAPYFITKPATLMDDSGEERSPHVEPSVSEEKWKLHIRKKLERGYVLIISSSQSSANFFKPGAGYESCSYRAAKQLVVQGAVVNVGTHYLGAVYQLVAKPVVAVPVA